MQVATIKEMISLEGQIMQFEKFLFEIEQYIPVPNNSIAMVARPYQNKPLPKSANEYNAELLSKNQTAPYTRYEAGMMMHEFVHGPANPLQQDNQPGPVKDFISILCTTKKADSGIDIFNISPAIVGTMDIFNLAKTNAAVSLHLLKAEFESYFPFKYEMRTVTTLIKNKKVNKKVKTRTSTGLTSGEYVKAKELLFNLENAYGLLNELTHNTHDYFELKVFASNKTGVYEDYEAVDIDIRRKMYNEEKDCLESIIAAIKRQIKSLGQY